MPPVIQIFIISFILALDAFSVSIAEGIKSQKAKAVHAVKISAFFGAFQAGMPVIGWFIGEALKGFIASVDHWIAFILLGVIGLKMIHEALNNTAEEKRGILNTKTLLLLSIATSIDALVIGITLSLLKIPFFVSITTIGVVTFILSFLGFIFGKQLGVMFGKKVEILGGVTLVLIALKILIEHLIG